MVGFFFFLLCWCAITRRVLLFSTNRQPCGRRLRLFNEALETLADPAAGGSVWGVQEVHRIAVALFIFMDTPPLPLSRFPRIVHLRSSIERMTRRHCLITTPSEAIKKSCITRKRWRAVWTERPPPPPLPYLLRLSRMPPPLCRLSHRTHPPPPPPPPLIHPMARWMPPLERAFVYRIIQTPTPPVRRPRHSHFSLLLQPPPRNRRPRQILSGYSTPQRIRVRIHRRLMPFRFTDFL